MKLINFLLKTVFIIYVAPIHGTTAQTVLPDENLIVTLNYGTGAKVRGTKEKSFDKKRDFYSYRGIFFAEAPVGEMRLKVML